jgi:DNA-binding transcriptional LysR family regulator
MTLEQLRIFASVAERLHMTRAAEALHITQSAASAGVAALEARHGVRLFERVGRGLELSEAGRVFLPEAKAVLARAAIAAQALDDLAGLRRGAIAIAASQTVSSYWLPARLARFAESHPGVGLRLTVGNTQQVAESVVEGSADLGFVEGPVDHAVLRRKAVGSDRISLYAAPSHPFAAQSAVTAEDLRGALWVLREPGSGTRSELQHALTQAGVDFAGLRVLLELPSNEAVLAAVEKGGMVTAVSGLAAQPLVTAGRLRPLAFEFRVRSFTMLMHKERHQSRAVTAFVDQL